MHFRVLGWAGFIFLAAGLAIMLFLPPQWSYVGCGSILTAVTLYIIGLIMVARQIATIRRRANQMLQRLAEEMERKKSQ